MKRKRTKNFIQLCVSGDFDSAAEVFKKLGFIVYEDPSMDGDGFIVSNIRLTYGDFIELYVDNCGKSKSARREAREWATEAFGELSNKELTKI